jgi:NitT/TauT family transport system substrate-binding protein
VDSLGFKPEFLAKRKDDVKKIDAAWNEAIAFMQTNTAEADAIMAKFSNLTPDIFAIEKAGVIFYGGKENKEWFAAGGKLATTSQRAADVWYDLKLIKNKPNVADLIDGSFLE